MRELRLADVMYPATHSMVIRHRPGALGMVVVTERNEKGNLFAAAREDVKKIMDFMQQYLDETEVENDS